MSNIKKAHDRKYHYVYKTTNIINGKYYIGLKSSNSLNDDYLGSGILIKKAILKYGKDSFIKEILKVFNSREEASRYEEELVNNALIKDKKCYNLCVGGDDSGAGLRIVSEESKHKNRLAHLGKNHNDATKELCRDIMIKEHLKRKETGKVYQRIKKSRNTVESKEKTRNQALKQWNDPEFREKTVSKIKSAANTDEFKAKSSFNAHKRFHVYKNLIKEECKWCTTLKPWWL